MMETLTNYIIILKVCINKGLGEKTELDYGKCVWHSNIKELNLHNRRNAFPDVFLPPASNLTRR